MKWGPVSYTSNLEDLGAAILAYAEVYTKKDLPEILEDQAAKLSCSAFGPDNQGLFQESAAAAPSEEYLTALPPTLNWRIKRHNGPRPVFTQGYQLLSYKRDSKGGKKGEYRLNKKGQLQRKIIGQEGEMNRRIGARYFQAAGWLSSRLGKYAAGAASGVGQKSNRAQVTIVLTGSVLSVSIINTSPAALEVAERTGYLARAVENRIRDLNEYTNRKLQERTAALNATKLPAPH